MSDYVDEGLREKRRPRQLDTVTYDTKGNEIERMIYDDYGFLVGKEVRTRDGDGNLVESALTDPKGAIMERRVYSYDKGNLTQIIRYDAKGGAVLRQVDSYDAGGRLVEEAYFDSKKLLGKTVYKYDPKASVSEVSFYMANGSKAIAPIGPCLGAHRVTYVNNAEGTPSRVVAFEPDGKLKQSWQYTYTPRGEVAEDVRESSYSVTRFVYVYEYDSQGNWIKQVATISDHSKFSDDMSYLRKTAVLREIKYY